SFLSMIDVVMIQGRTEINGKPARRAFWVKEVLNLDPSKTELVTNDVYRWDAKHDIFSYSGQSHILEEIMEKRGLDSKEIEEELHRRKTVLEWMVKKQTRKYTEVGDVIREYSVNPAQVYRKARMKAH
ncbi:MAG: secretion system protein E, partial [Candidatus Bathyarchaeota archaeon]